MDDVIHRKAPKATDDTPALIEAAQVDVAKTWRASGNRLWRYSEASVIAINLMLLDASSRALAFTTGEGSHAADQLDAVWKSGKKLKNFIEAFEGVGRRKSLFLNASGQPGEASIPRLRASIASEIASDRPTLSVRVGTARALSVVFAACESRRWFAGFVARATFAGDR